MIKFAMFEDVEEGQPVAINIENVTYVRPRIDGNGVFIAFQGDDGIGVKGTWDEVVDRLSRA